MEEKNQDEYFKGTGINLMAKVTINIKKDQKPVLSNQKIQAQNRKWKKNVKNNLQGIKQKIQLQISAQLKKHNIESDEFKYSLISKTQAQLSSKQREEDQKSFKDYRSKVTKLNQKIYSFESEIGKMNRLKQMTNICQQKRFFYDNCLDEYFSKEQNAVQQIINKFSNSKSSQKNL